MTVMESIEQQAKYLASENRKAEPGITKIYWFPDDHEVRLVSLLDEMPTSQDGILRPFYFRASPEHGLTAPSSVTLIRSDEFGTLRLPASWGSWNDAVEI
jgi:hypothetical protein